MTDHNASETSLFEQCGYSREAIQARLERNWYEMFEGPDKIYWENDEGLGYVMDTGNHDVRTEGMSYAMMIAVQYGRKDVFDKLWGWVMKYMFMTEGLHQGYFAWSVDPSGVPNADGPAPDGEEYFAMDLFLASAQWGDGEGVYEYSRHARSILHTCVHQGEDGEGYPMWNQVHPGNRMDRPVLPSAALLRGVRRARRRGRPSVLGAGRQGEPRVPGHRLPPADRHEPRILELRRHAAR